ncbi:ATP-binding cassette domain-containing protein [Microbacterium sp. NRRL B-14842]|uniref:ATP-binding cassette domain-containing protein n=1 Tax=Microbacterium sp. NRRL B-14842 TaxID=3162881 RepID=UPI003D2D5B71
MFDGIDLAVPRGQITGLLGPSGCGKTTLMRSIVGVQRIASGDVTVLGEPGGFASAPAPRGLRYAGRLGLRRPQRAAELSYFASLLKAPKG